MEQTILVNQIIYEGNNVVLDGTCCLSQWTNCPFRSLVNLKKEFEIRHKNLRRFVTQYYPSAVNSVQHVQPGK